MKILEITKEKLTNLFQDISPEIAQISETDHSKCGYHLDVHVSKEHLHSTVALIDELEFFIESITGVDWPKENEIEVCYDFNRYDANSLRILLRVRTDREKPEVDSISDIYTGANWHERETHDFFGVKFINHPHLIPLLLPEDADFHPLLKDFKA